MAYDSSAERTRAVHRVRDVLRASRSAVLTTHLNADGDGAGSEAALSSWMRANGTEAWIVNPTPFPDTYRFLVESEDWIVPAGSSRARDLCARADLAVVLDTGEVPRIGRVRSLIRDLPAVVIDHHQPGDKPIGGVALRDADASATGELVHEVIASAKGPWNDVILRGIYIALLTDTGSFRFSNSTPSAHRLAADLIEAGVDPEEMYERAYGAAPLRKYRLLERALASLDTDEEHGIAWMTIPTDAYEEVGANPEDLEGMVDVPRSVDGTRVGLLFRMASTGDVKVSFRSTGEIDVNALARRFGGGGHVKASGAMVGGPMDRAMDEVLTATREAVRAHLSDGAGKTGGEPR